VLKNSDAKKISLGAVAPQEGERSYNWALLGTTGQ
jgi:hypothetical protein